MDAARMGSVITRDYAINILIHLATIPSYASDIFTLLTELLLDCPANHLPMYAERAFPVVCEHERAAFVDTFRLRLKDLEKEVNENELKR